MPRHKFVSPLAEPCSVVCDVCFLQAVIYREKISGAKAIFAISDACFLQALVEVWTVQRALTKCFVNVLSWYDLQALVVIFFKSGQASFSKGWPAGIFQKWSGGFFHRRRIAGV